MKKSVQLVLEDKITFVHNVKVLVMGKTLLCNLNIY